MKIYQCKSIGCVARFYAAVSQDFCEDCQDGSPAQPPLLGVDPYGKNQHERGAKVDVGKVRMHLITGGMARAITEVAKVGTFGAAKYTDGGWVDVPDGFRRYEDAQQRHAADRHRGEMLDKESQLLHLAHEAWNALAKLDLHLRETEKKVEYSKDRPFG